MEETGEAARPRTLVLALGNPLRGDDGVGAAVLAALAELPDLPGGVTLLEGGTPGLETVLLLEGYARAIVVDAADMGRQPGAWARFTPADVSLGTGAGGNLHSAGLAEALALGGALGILPAEIVIYGVQPALVGWEPGLSDDVRAAVPEVCRAIRQEVGTR